MKIAMIVHGLPPAAWGGTELHTLALARAYVAAGHRVLVVAREADPGREELDLRSESREGFEIRWVNNCFRGILDGADVYRRPALAAAVLPFLEEFAPAVVHTQHLTCLSTDLALECARRWPLVSTLNDYWMICHRGQMLDRDLKRCAGPHRGCRNCLGAGGLLTSGLAIGYLRSIHPTFGRLPDAARWILMEFGLLIFMAGVGLRAGGNIIETFATAGPVLVVAGICVTMIPIFVGYLFGRKVLKIHPVLLLGGITGSMTSGASLSVVTKAANSSVPSLGYTGAYAFANVLLTIAGSIILFF